jgi:hypothetical protein
VEAAASRCSEVTALHLVAASVSFVVLRGVMTADGLSCVCTAPRQCTCDTADRRLHQKATPCRAVQLLQQQAGYFMHTAFSQQQHTFPCPLFLTATHSPLSSLYSLPATLWQWHTVSGGRHTVGNSVASELCEPSCKQWCWQHHCVQQGQFTRNNVSLLSNRGSLTSQAADLDAGWHHALLLAPCLSCTPV